MMKVYLLKIYKISSRFESLFMKKTDSNPLFFINVEFHHVWKLTSFLKKKKKLDKL